MKGKINDVLSQISEDVLSDDSKKMLIEAFEDTVEIAVNERLELEITSALQKLDETHTTKLEQLLESIDQNHSAMLIAVLEKIDNEHTEKMEYLIKRNEKALSEDAVEFKKNLLEQISNYMDLYLENAIPKEELREAITNKRAQKILEQMKQMIALDDSYINETIKEAVDDGRRTIDTLKRELNEAVKQNIQVTQVLKNRTAELVLEKSLAGVEKSKKEYVLRMLKGKDPEYITENLDYVVKMFDKEEEDQREVVTEQATKSTKVIREKVDTPPRSNKVENASAPESEGVVDYLSVLKNQDRFSTK